MENHTNSKGPIPILNSKVHDKREGCCWSLPPKGWFKANFDGATKGNPRKAGVGGIIRNEHGKGIAAFSTPIGSQTNHYAKAIAAHLTIKLAKEM